MTVSGPRVLMLASACYPLTGPEAIVNAKLVLAALNSGWEIDVLSLLHKGCSYPQDNIATWRLVQDSMIYGPNSLVRKGLPRIAREVWGAIRTGCFLPGSGWASWAVCEGVRMAKKKRYDFILSRSFPGLLAGPVLSHKTGIPLIVNWNDPWPSRAYPLPYGEGVGASFSRSERLVLSAASRQAAWHTFPSERLRRYICSYLSGNAPDRSSVIPHIAVSEFRRELMPRHNEKLVIFHAGQSGGPRESDVLCAGVRKFIDRQSTKPALQIKMLGVRFNDFIESAQAEGISEQVSIIGAISYEKSLDAMADSDCLMIIEGKWEEGIFLPSKLVDYVQIGNPILALSPKNGTVSDILSLYGGGIAVDNESSDRVAEAIERLYQSWEARYLEDRYGSSHLYRLFSEETVLKQYAELFERLTEQFKAASS